MHCSTLFKVAAEPGADVFAKLDAAAYKRARKVCVAAILHTDAALHSNMVKDLKKLNEINQDICDAQAQSNFGLTEDYIHTVLNENVLLFEELFLHLADISNPLKPWPICQEWAGRVLDEFFAQGDEEKSLGIPVGMLNDREKINRPGSQHGFINFMVAPFVFEAVRIFQPFDTLATQMASNLEQWRTEWVASASPNSEAIAKRDIDVQNVKATAEKLFKRGDIV